MTCGRLSKASSPAKATNDKHWEEAHTGDIPWDWDIKTNVEYDSAREGTSTSKLG